MPSATIMLFLLVTAEYTFFHSKPGCKPFIYRAKRSPLLFVFGFCYNHGKWPGISKEASLGGLGAWNRRKVAISSLSGFPLGRWVFNSWGSVDRKQEAFLCSSGLVAGGSWGQSRDWSLGRTLAKQELLFEFSGPFFLCLNDSCNTF